MAPRMFAFTEVDKYKYFYKCMISFGENQLSVSHCTLEQDIVQTYTFNWP